MDVYQMENTVENKKFGPPDVLRYKAVRTPTVIQMEALECGAATLGMILRYYGLYVPLEELRKTCGISRDGSKASYIVRAAREYHLDASGFRKEPEELFDLKPPFIIFWNFNHFVVVDGFSKKYVHINDPASGPRKISYEEFDKSFTGVVLCFEPTEKFVKGGNPPSVIKSLKKRLHGSWNGLAYIILAGLALVIPGLVTPIFSKLFVDKILVSGLNNFLVPLLIGMTFVAVLKTCLSYLQSYFLIRLEAKLALSMSTKFFWHVLNLPYSFFTQRYAGDIANRVHINDRIAQVLSGEFAGTAINVTMVVFYAALMLAYDKMLTSIGIAMALLNFMALRFVMRKQADANARLINESAKLSSMTVNGLHTIETLKSSGSESDFFARWAGVQAKVSNAQQELRVDSLFITSIPSLLSAMNTAIILLVGGLRVMHGEISLGTLIAFQSLMGSFMDPINSFVGLSNTLQETDQGLKRLDDVFDYQSDTSKAEKKPPSARQKNKLSGHIEIKNLTFGYNTLESPLIFDFNLTVKPGQRIALVGGSGSGKSTISKMLAGLYDSWSGEILFDGKPREKIPEAVLASSIAMVDQEISLFDGTVQDNISMWDPSIPKEVIVQAAKDAYIHGDIDGRPNGYDGKVEEGGRNYSGGQRQRLEIARALAITPSILIMDEATSALDPTTEKLIDESIRRRGCTTIIVAHRLSTIRDCDEIIVLEYGEVVERGTHEEMKDAGGPYSRLIRS